MCDRLDLEVRIYLTGRPGGQLEWQVTTVAGDGQVSWVDGQISTWAPGRNVVPPELAYCVGKSLRAGSRVIRELE